MVWTYTHGIVLVLLNQTYTRGPSVTRMRDFFHEWLDLGRSGVRQLDGVGFVDNRPSTH